MIEFTDPLEFHPIAFTFRPLTIPEREMLRESIRAHGCRNPITVWRRPDGKLVGIDGRHRYDLCRELQLPFKRDVFEGTEAEAEALAQSLNDDRRHQTPQEKQERVEKVAQLRRQGQSLRTIAEAVGVSEKRVRDDLKSAEKKGVEVKPRGGKVKGKDGREQAAAKRVLCDRCKRVGGGGIPGCSACSRLNESKPVEDEVVYAPVESVAGFMMGVVRECCEILKGQAILMAKDFGLGQTREEEGIKRKIEEVVKDFENWRFQLQRRKV